MSKYQNFTVDFPKRMAELDKHFRPIADSKDLEVTYLLMKLASAFTLPYERVAGDSGTRGLELDPSKAEEIRCRLYLDQEFCETRYCKNPKDWCWLDVEHFGSGPERWQAEEREIPWAAHQVLALVRNAIAHSNLFFAATRRIEYVFLGSRKDRRPSSDRRSGLPDLGPYRVVRGSVAELGVLVDTWMANVQKLELSPAAILAELDTAA